MWEVQPFLVQPQIPLPVVTSWDPNNTSSHLTLSNNNLTFAGNGGGGGTFNTFIISGSTRSSGKLYFEFADSHANAQYIGIATSAANLNNQNVGNASCNYGNTGAAVTTGNFDGSIFTVTAANVPSGNPTAIVQYAIDFGAGKIWLGYDNTWGGSNPSTGNNPVYTFTPSGSYFIMGSENAVLTNAVTLNAIASSQSFSPPSGFSAWG